MKLAKGRTNWREVIDQFLEYQREPTEERRLRVLAGLVPEMGGVMVTFNTGLRDDLILDMATETYLALPRVAELYKIGRSVRHVLRRVMRNAQLIILRQREREAEVPAGYWRLPLGFDTQARIDNRIYLREIIETLEDRVVARSRVKGCDAGIRYIVRCFQADEPISFPVLVLQHDVRNPRFLVQYTRVLVRLILYDHWREQGRNRIVEPSRTVRAHMDADGNLVV